MILSMPLPARAGKKTSSRPSDLRRAPRIVICHPAALCAEAIEAVVHKHTRWRVACTSTDMDVATVAVRIHQAQALLFESHSDTTKGVGALVRRVRLACPDVALILFTARAATAFLERALKMGVGACVHNRESLLILQSALQAAECGRPYRSPVIEACLTGSPGLRTRERFGAVSAFDQYPFQPLAAASCARIV